MIRGLGPRPGEGQRERRRHRPGAPAGLHRAPSSPRRSSREMAAPPGPLRPGDACAWAAAWAPPASSSGYRKEERIMATDTQAPVRRRQGRQLPDRGPRRPSEIFTPEDFTDEQRMIARDRRDFMRERGGCRGSPRSWRSSTRSPASCCEGRRAGPAGHRGPRGVRRPGPRQGLGLPRRREVGPRRQLRRRLHGPHRHRHAAHRLLRHRGAEAEVPAEVRHRRVDQRLLAVRGRAPAPTP